MRKISTRKMLVCSILVLALAAGCGGGKKKAEKAGSPVGIVSGKVDLFSGFGVQIDAAGRADMIAGGADVKAYRIKPDGDGLVEIEDSAAKPLQGDAFRLDSVPIDERNLILRIETKDGQSVLSAILPPLASGDNPVAVNPETDLEARLLIQMAKSGVADQKDLKPWEIEASFVKQFVTDGLFFDMPGPENPDMAVEALLPVARAAYARFIKTLFGKDIKPSETAALKLMKDVAGPLMRLETAYDTGAPVGPAAAEADASLAGAVRGAGITVDSMPEPAIWQNARRGALLWAAGCLAAKKGAEGCPLPSASAAGIGGYGPILEDALRSRWDTEDMSARMNAVWPEGIATDTELLPPVETIAKIAGLPDKSIAPFAKTRNDFTDETGPDARADAQKRWMSNLRDDLLVGVLDMSAESVYKMIYEVYKAADPLADAVNGMGADAGRIGAVHKKFIADCDSAFAPLHDAVRAKFPRLEDQDRGKMEWSFRELILNSTLFNLPPAFYVSVDTDRDGIADNAERVIGTDPADDKSAPAPAIASTPSIMLPHPPADSDDDGFPDAVEKAAGTKPADAASKPTPGAMEFCKEKTAVCLGPSEKRGGEYAIEGGAVYKEKPFPGVVAGAFDSSLFGDRKPVAASEAAAANGTFKIGKLGTGAYFVVAFSDSDGDGRPSPGEAIGFAGGLYPRRIKVASGPVEMKEQVVMLGIYGQAKCQAGLYYDPAAAACAGECSAGMEPDSLSRECLCASGTMLVEPEGKCAASCPETMVKDPAGRRCSCPQGTTFDKAQRKCVCPEGMSLDASSNQCRCQKGMLYEVTMTCVEKCPATFKADNETGACACPEGSAIDRAMGHCRCDKGLMNPYEEKCVEACPPGMSADGTGEACSCPEREEYSPEKKVCECASGLERDAITKKCAAPGEHQPAQPGPGQSGRPTAAPEGAPHGAQPAAQTGAGKTNPFKNRGSQFGAPIAPGK
jgi:hypothetical protein